MTAPTPEPTTDPTPEAELVASGINLACALSLCCRDGTKDRAVVMDRPEAIKNIARALDSFAQAAVERERESCAAAIDCGGPNGCGEWISKKGRGHKKGNGHCMAHDGYCAHDLAAQLRHGDEP